MSNATVTMRVRYLNGDELRLECPSTADDLNVATRMQEALQRNQLLVETKDRLLVIPLSGVMGIEVSPSPPKLPRDAIRQARVLEDESSLSTSGE